MAECLQPGAPRPGGACSRRGFSLIELVVVLAVTLILAGILMPALSGLRRHTERVFSASNMRQIGMGMTMYATDSGGRLPFSQLINRGDGSAMQEMMATFLGRRTDENRQAMVDQFAWAQWMEGWEGIGVLYGSRYLDAPQVFYCPSHEGDHPFDRYLDDYLDPHNFIYSNYHYRGDIDLEDQRRPLTFERDSHRVFLTDGMRTRRDFNHKVGFNSLLGDGSVWWRFDTTGALLRRLPLGVVQGAEGEQLYRDLWEIIDG